MIVDLEVRLANVADAVDIAMMSRDYIEYGLPWRWRYGRIVKFLNDPETNIAVAEKQGVLIAFGIMSYIDDEAHLLLFAVRRAHQRRGIGTALLQWLESVARTAGVQRIRLECRLDNLPARNFYWANGYHEHQISEAMYSNAIDGVRLEKWLRADAPA